VPAGLPSAISIPVWCNWYGQSDAPNSVVILPWIGHCAELSTVGSGACAGAVCAGIVGAEEGGRGGVPLFITSTCASSAGLMTELTAGGLLIIPKTLLAEWVANFIGKTATRVISPNPPVTPCTKKVALLPVPCAINLPLEVVAAINDCVAELTPLFTAFPAELVVLLRLSDAVNKPLVIIFGLFCKLESESDGAVVFAACTLGLGTIKDTNNGKSNKAKTIRALPTKKRILNKNESEYSTIGFGTFPPTISGHIIHYYVKFSNA
jgi:hypothetical protein